VPSPVDYAQLSNGETTYLLIFINHLLLHSATGKSLRLLRFHMQQLLLPRLLLLPLPQQLLPLLLWLVMLSLLLL